MSVTANTQPRLDSSISEAATRSLQAHLDVFKEGTDGTEPANIYRMVLDEVERPMLEIIMRYTHGNQSNAALILGINRATLRTKLKRHNLL